MFFSKVSEEKHSDIYEAYCGFGVKVRLERTAAGEIGGTECHRFPRRLYFYNFDLLLRHMLFPFKIFVRAVPGAKKARPYPQYTPPAIAFPCGMGKALGRSRTQRVR